MQKQKSYRSKKYLAWVRTLPCVVCGAPADDAHHAIALGHLSGMGMTAADSFTMPACRGCHTRIHNEPDLWPMQWEWIARTLSAAVASGFNFNA